MIYTEKVFKITNLLRVIFNGRSFKGELNYCDLYNFIPPFGSYLGSC